MNISDLIDQIVDVKSQREALTKKDSELSKLQSQIEADLMHAMTEAGTLKAANEAGHSVTMKKSVHPTIIDWDQFYAYVTQTNSFDLLHKRLSSTAFKDRWEAGEEIPGSSSAEVWGISLTKSRK